MKLRTNTLARGMCFAAIPIIASVAFTPEAEGAVVGEDLKLVPGDAATGDEFGLCVSVDGGLLAAGAPFDDEGGEDSGAAYVFDANSGVELFKLLPGDGGAGDQFGSSVALAGDFVVVGAPGGDDNGDESGAAYVFDAVTGAQITKLLPDDGSAGDSFGNAVATDAGVVAVGAMSEDGFAENGGAVYLFDAATGVQLRKLVPEEDGNRAFGVSVAMDSGVVVAGARMNFDVVEGFTLGAAYLFDVSTGDQLHRLESENNTWTDLFGEAVDIDDGVVAVGAWGRSIFYDHSGAAYLFDVSTGAQTAYIFPEDGHDRDHFGMSISISGGVVAIGADEDDDTAWSSGSAYLYDVSSGSLSDKLLISDGAEFDRFGSSISIDDGLVASGAIGFGSSGTPTGYVGVFGADAAAEVADGPALGNMTYSAWPNPFRSETTISYDLEVPGPVTVDVVAIDGRRIRSLVAATDIHAGRHSVQWDGRNEWGDPVPAGVYFVRVLRPEGGSQGRLIRVH